MLASAAGKAEDILSLNSDGHDSVHGVIANHLPRMLHRNKIALAISVCVDGIDIKIQPRFREIVSSFDGATHLGEFDARYVIFDYHGFT